MQCVSLAWFPCCYTSLRQQQAAEALCFPVVWDSSLLPAGRPSVIPPSINTYFVEFEISVKPATWVCITEKIFEFRCNKRNRAAGWVSYGQKWKTGTGRQYLRTLYYYGGLATTYDVQLGHIGKRVVDFLLVLIDFFHRCYGWGATSEYRFKIGDFATMGTGWPKISGRRGPPTTIILLRKLGYTWSFVCQNSCVWRTDRQKSHR